MKKKLIAVVLSVTVIAGVGAVVYNTNKHSDNIEVTENKAEVVMDNLSDIKEKTVEESSELAKNNEKATTSASNNNSNGNTLGEQINSQPNKPSNPLVEESPVAPPVEDKPVTPPVDQKPVTPPPSESKPETPTVDGQFMASVEQAIFNMVNQERAKAGVPALSYNNTMQKYARIKSQDMGDRNYFDHNNPEGELITAQMQRDGVTYNAWGENIAYIGGGADANTLATQFMNNWMNSDGHRKNILSTNFSGIGVGVYKAGNKVYATQEFYR